MELESREEGLQKELQHYQASAESANTARRDMAFERDSALQRVELKEEANDHLKVQFDDALKKNRDVDDMLEQTRRVIKITF